MAVDNSSLMGLSFSNLVPEDTAAPNSLYASYMASNRSLDSFRAGTDMSVPFYRRVNYADPADSGAVSFGSATDPFILDTDPTGAKTVEYGRRIGQPYTSESIVSLNMLGGKSISSDTLSKSEAGRELLWIALQDRRGTKRGFWEALTDISAGDLPFFSLVGTVAGSVADAKQVSDTMKKLQNGDEVSDDDLIKTTLYFQKSKRESQGTWGSTVGNIMRQAPGFMLEFLATGGLAAGARVTAVKAGERGIHLGMTRASKIATRELVEAEAKKTAGELADQTAEGIAKTIVNQTMRGNPLYRDLGEDSMLSLARKRVGYELAEYRARTAGGAVGNGLRSFGQYLKQHFSQGLIDFGTWGTEEATVAFTGHGTASRALADAVAAFVVEAPIRGGLMYATNQYAAKPLIETVTGESVSQAQLGLQQTALLTNNSSLMENAESIAAGQNFLEYVSENAGRGFTPLLRFVGMGIDRMAARAGWKGARLVGTPSQVMFAGSAPLVDREAEVTVGGKMREWVSKVFGTREDLVNAVQRDKAGTLARSLGITDDAGRQALSVAVRSGTPETLSREVLAKMGISAPATEAGRKAFDDYVLRTMKDAKSVKEYTKFWLANFMTRHNIGPESVMNWFQKTGYDGIVGEMFEERYSDFAKGLFGWDDRPENEKNFFDNLKTAFSNIRPDWDQWTAEAVGFAMPMVTRAVVMRAQAQLGGGGELMELQRNLEVIRDATRIDEVIQGRFGDYIKWHDFLSKQDEADVESARAAVEAAKASGNLTEAESLQRNLDQAILIRDRRAARHEKFVAAVPEAVRDGDMERMARENLSDIVVAPLLSNQTLASDEYDRIPVYTSEQAAGTFEGHLALVNYAPKLAKQLYKAAASFEGEHMPWYRTVAHKFIGFAGGLVTGDFSAMRTNPVQWHAEDLGLAPQICKSLKKLYADEFSRQKEVALQKYRGTIMAGEDATYHVPLKEIEDATDAAVAQKARDIMSAHMQAQQLRAFSQDRMRDQALEHVASQHGMTATVEADPDTRDRRVMFYEVGSDGSFVDGSGITAEQVAERYGDEVKKATGDIAKATVDLMCRGTTGSRGASAALMSMIRIPRGSDETLGPAIYEAALALVGSSDSAFVQKIDGSVPLRDVMTGDSVSKVNMDVVSYIARFSTYDDKGLDPRAYESVARALGVPFDGTAGSLEKRNRKLFRMAKLANVVKDGKAVYYVGSTMKVEDHDSRLNSGNAFPLKAELREDGKYHIVAGKSVDPVTGKLMSDESFADRETLDRYLADRGFTPTTARIVFTQARLFEFDNMFTAIRELGLAAAYRDACGNNQHPMLRRNEAGNAYFYDSEDAARDQFERELMLASFWDSESQRITVDTLPKGVTEKEVKAAWDAMWNRETGYMTIGERLLSDRGVEVDAVYRYTGDFTPYSRPRYTLKTNVSRIRNDSADIYVPISFTDGDSFETALINAHLLNGYAKHPVLLRDALNGVLSEFIHQTAAVVDNAIRSSDAKADEELRDSLESFRRSLLEEPDRWDPVAGVLKRGVGVTPASFVQLASHFACFRALDVNSWNPHARAISHIADTVWQLPSFLPFMDTVDLVLGGNGFLSAIISEAAGEKEPAEDQRGIRAVMTAATGKPDAFREAVKKTLSAGETYESFLKRCQDAFGTLERSGSGVSTSVSRAEALAKVVNDTPRVTASLDVEGDDADSQEVAGARASAAVAAAKEDDTRAREVVSAATSVRSAEAVYKQKLTAMRAAQAKLATMRATRSQAQNDPGSPLSPFAPTVYDVAAAKKDVDDRKAELRAAVEGGNSSPRLSELSSQVFRALEQRAADGGPDTSSEEADPDAPVGGDLMIGTSDSQYELPYMFRKMIGNDLVIRHGVEEQAGFGLTPSQASLAADVVVRSLLAVNVKTDDSGITVTTPITESDVAEFARRMFPGMTDSDVTAVVAKFRKREAELAERGMSMASFKPSVGSLWADEADDEHEEGTSENRFNEAAVAEFESKALGDFLALAQKASPETGRNFQAFLSNIRELNRWQRSFANEHSDSYSEGSLAAIEYMYGMLNPRSGNVGKNMTERLAVFEKLLRDFDEQAGSIRSHIKALLEGGRKGRTLSHKGAFLLSYMMSLSANDRTRFAVLVSNSVSTSPIHIARDGRMEARVRNDHKMPEGVVTDSFSGLIGKTAAEIRELITSVRAAVAKKSLRGMTGPADMIEKNGMQIALALSEVIGTESPLFSALTSPRLIRHIRMTLDRGSDTDKSNLRYLATSMTSGENGCEFVDTVLNMLEQLTTVKGRITRDILSVVAVTSFASGDALKGGVTRAPNSSRITSPLFTLMSYYDASLPETVTRADHDPKSSRDPSSVAIASRGVIPLGNRFMDRMFDKICAKYFPNADERLLRECRQDLTWPDKYRTPIFAKSLSKDRSAADTYAACEKSYRDGGPVWWVPVYAGDHSSAVIMQIPKEVSVGKEANVGGVKDYETAANLVGRWIGLDLLGSDAKRSAISSLECEGASMVGAMPAKEGEEQRFGENRVFILHSFNPGFSNEEMKGTTLIQGYGARQLAKMAKDPTSSMIKAHLINSQGPALAFIKSLSLFTGHKGEFGEGSVNRVLTDFITKRVRDEYSTAILTDHDSYKVGIASSKQATAVDKNGTAHTLMSVIFDELGKRIADGSALDVYEGDKLDELIPRGLFPDGLRLPGLKMPGHEGDVYKVSEVLPGVRLERVEGLYGDAYALSFTEDGMIGYTVANVSHDSTQPKDPARTPRNHEIDAVAMAMALARLSPDDSRVGDISAQVLDLISDWGIVASATVSSRAFIEAAKMRSASIRELLRYGEAQDGQNIKEELVRLVNAELRRNLNIPLNAIDAALTSNGALAKEDGSIQDLTKSEMRRAFHKGSEIFSLTERGFYGATRRLALCDVNCAINGFRYSWFLNEGEFNSSTEWCAKYFEKAGSETGDRAVLVAMEEMFKDLRRLEKSHDSLKVRELRRHIAMSFQDHHGVTLLERKEGDKSVGEELAYRVSFEDLFRADGAFDRTAVQIEADRIPLESNGGTPRIVLGGTAFGLPRTPSYNGSMWLQVVRAGLPVTEIRHDNGTYSVGRDAMVAPDPFSLNILGCDHDGDKTKMYMLYAGADGTVDYADIPRVEMDENGVVDPDRFATDGDVREEFREKCRASGLFDRQYVDENGSVQHLRDDDPEREGEFEGLSVNARRQVSNRFVRLLLEMARELPVTDENGVDRALPDRRVKFAGGIVSRSTKAFPVVKKDVDGRTTKAYSDIVSNAARPVLEGHNIGEIKVSTEVSDGANDASSARANIVSMMQGLHWAWTTGYFHGGVYDLFGTDVSAKDWFNFMYHADGLSNATFDDMKEQMCSRLGWTSGMVGVLMTDVIRNVKEDGTRGKLPTTDDEFAVVLSRYSAEINTENSLRNLMRRATDMSNTGFLEAAAKVLGSGFSDSDKTISRKSIIGWLGLEQRPGETRTLTLSGKIDKQGNFVPKMDTVGSAIAAAVVEAAAAEGISEDAALSGLVDAGARRGANPILGYLVYLARTVSGSLSASRDFKVSGGIPSALKDAAKEYIGFRKTYDAVSKAREFASTFNYLNADVGRDTESGRRDRILTGFHDMQDYVSLEGQKNLAMNGVITTSAGNFNVFHALQRMNLATRVAFDVGDDLMTVAARGHLSSNRFYGNVARLVERGYTDVAAKLLSLGTPISSYSGNRMKLEANAQQIGYVISAFTSLPEVEGSPVRTGLPLYNALRGLSTGVIAAHARAGQNGSLSYDHRNRALDLCNGIEAMFEVMYRLAASSTEHRTSNPAFAFFREASDSAFGSEPGKDNRPYGESGVRRFSIKPMFRLSSEEAVDRVRRFTRLIIDGKSFSGTRQKNFIGRNGKPARTVATSFSLTVDNLDAMLEEAKTAGVDELKELKTLVADAKAALVGMGDAVLGKGKGSKFEVTPAMMFGQLLPMYSVITTRTLGGPTPTSASLLNLLPKEIYQALSDGQVRNDASNRDLVDAAMALEWAPVRNSTYTFKANKKTKILPASYRNEADRVQKAIDELDRDGDVGTQVNRAAAIIRGDFNAEGYRRNPEFRHIMDPFAGADVMPAIIEALGVKPGPSRRGQPSVGAIVTGAADLPAGVIVRQDWLPPDQRIAGFARAIGALVGSWAEVRYVGGSSFEIRGRLRGDLGTGRNVVITVSMGDSAKTGETDEQIRAMASSYAYATSLCACTNFTYDGAPLTAERFMSLPLSAREAFVRRYSVGAASSNPIAWTVDGKGVATLVGAIRLNGEENGTKIYHEYFHQMMRMFDAVGLFSEEDKAALARLATGKKRSLRRNAQKDVLDKAAEEKLAEKFRQWVEGNTDVSAKEETGVFRRIFDFLVGLLTAIKNAFSYDELSEDAIFSMVVHGIAQTTESRRNEIAYAVENGQADGTLSGVSVSEAISRVTSGGRFTSPSVDYNDPEDVRRALEGAAEDDIELAIELLEKGSEGDKRRVRRWVDSFNLERVKAEHSQSLEEYLKAPADIDPGALTKIDELDFDPNVTQEHADAGVAASDALSAVLADKSSSFDDINSALGTALAAREVMANDVGFTFSVPFGDGVVPEPLADLSVPVVPGESAYTESEVRAAVDAGTVYANDRSVMSRLGGIIMKAVNDSLKAGPWQGDVKLIMRGLGKPTNSSYARQTALAGVRAALAIANPSAKINTEELENSIVFKALLCAYQGLESSAKPGKDSAAKEHASFYDVSGWLLSSRFTTPSSLARDVYRRISEISERKDLGNFAAMEISRTKTLLWPVVKALSDPTGLSSRGYSGAVLDAIDDAIRELKVGTTLDGAGTVIDGDGRFLDILAVDSPSKKQAGSIEHASLLCKCQGDAPVQEVLKLALLATHQLAAMAKFYTQTNTGPITAADIEYRNLMRKRGVPGEVSDAEWAASQAIGDSLFTDNRQLVDYYDQSAFIADNVDAYLSSLVRKSFGHRPLRDMFMAENHEYGAIKSEIARLENFYSFLFGDNVEDGGELLKMIEQDRGFAMEFGAIVHGAFGKRWKFDNYHKIGCGVRMTEEDLQIVDLFKKMVSAYSAGQRGCVTGVDNIRFTRLPDFAHPEKYELGRITALEASRKEQLTDFEMALWRMTQQLPKCVLEGNVGFYRKVRDSVFSAVREAQNELLEFKGDVRQFDMNSAILRILERDGVIVAQQASHRDHTGAYALKRGALILPCDLVNDLFLNSETYRKLTDSDKGARPKEMLSRDHLRDQFMSTYRKAEDFAKRHAWLTRGDGRYLNSFGTSLPFFSGSGVFMYNAVRRDREFRRSYVGNLGKYEAGFLSIVSQKGVRDFAVSDSWRQYPNQIDFLRDVYRTRESGADLVKAITEGKYAEGQDLAERTGLVLRPDATLGDIADAIYSRLLERAMREDRGDEPVERTEWSADRVIKMYEDNRHVAGDVFGGKTGLNDEQMFRIHGVLPANDQVGHKVHKAIDGLTNAMMQRGTLVNMLMTPTIDGAPVYYARPDDLAVDVGGIPDVLWGDLARWWAEFNGLEYDPKLSGVKNAQRIYDQIRSVVKDEKNHGRNILHPAGVNEFRAHRYTELDPNESDLDSINGWMVAEDDDLGEDSSALNALTKGEAMGYLRHLVQSSRVLGLGGAKTRATLHRALSWSKTMSVSFSFFFPIATKWESPVGAVGAMATLGSNGIGIGKHRIDMAKHFREHPEIFSALQGILPGRGWITKDFLGFSDILEMMDSDDPFLAELVSWANALGISISDRLVNPVEPNKSLVASDIKKLQSLIRQSGGKDASLMAARFGRVMDSLVLSHGDRAFSYALNATKLAVVAQMAAKLRHEAEAAGKAFDPVRDLRRYSGYINAEIGGIDPLKYAWAHPVNRGIMNMLLFSWEWTRGAWEAGGGNVIEDLLFGGHNATKEEREFFFGRWARMFSTVMIGVPTMIQIAAMAVAKLLSGGAGDDDDRFRNAEWFTWRNEDKTRWTAADLTPLLKVLGSWEWLVGFKKGENAGGVLAKYLGGAAGAGFGGYAGQLGGRAFGTAGRIIGGLAGAAIGGLTGSNVTKLVPAYTGNDAANQTTRNRRLYLHFGKQGWEFFRWFDAPRAQFFSKLSMPVQRIMEGVLGRNLGYLDRALPWEEQGDVQRWLDLSTDGALFNLASAFLPFSVSGLTRTGDTGFLPVIGPVQYGASYTNVNDRLVDAFKAFAMNDRKYYAYGYVHPGKRAKWMSTLVTDILVDARKNGVGDKQLQTLVATSAGQVARDLYGQLFRAIPDDPSGDFDVKRIERIARALNRLGTKRTSIMDAIKMRLSSQQRDWSKVLTPEQREMYNTVIRGALARPFESDSLEQTVEELKAEPKPLDY